MKSKLGGMIHPAQTALVLAVSNAIFASSAMANTSMLEEVVVTATKREVNAQDIPIAITAVDGEVLNDLGIYSSVDLPKIAPGLKVVWQGPFPSFKMRGGGVAGLNGEAVPLYTNGLAGGTSWAGWVDLERHGFAPDTIAGDPFSHRRFLAVLQEYDREFTTVQRQVPKASNLATLYPSAGVRV